MGHFSDRVVIVTGGAQGIGRALCRQLVDDGARVVAADIDQQGGEQLVEALSGGRGTIVFHRVDVGDEQQVVELLESVKDNLGRIDIVFNNAGIAIAGDGRDLSFDQWRRVVDVNQWGVIYGAMTAFRIMAEQGSGHIVNVASLAGLIPFPTNLPYSATKFAVVGMSMSLRAEGHDLGVKVSAVCPGFIQSNIYEASEMTNVDRDKMMANIQFKMVDTDVAAAKILKGVERNRAIIVFPGYAKLFWWLYRLSPALIKPLALKMIRDFRKLRTTK